MSQLVEYREIQKTIAQMTARLGEMENDPKLKREMEFEDKLKALLGEYGKSLKDVIGLLAPEMLPAGKLVPGKRTRQLKVYINPHTEERVETKGGNHSTIKKWKAEYGAAAVDGWVQK